MKCKTTAMNYDNWKQSTPTSFDYEEGDTCKYCGEEVEDGKKFCGRECRIAYEND